ncbi:ATP-binding protein [Smaragdicoccus niigatensis]|uniref:ATP-binding protein n=1 Tax=Smaragdicoccus niigatensis TaxID=359359 RepID=UPI000380017C|nr:NB-ARC domain-containing protein [Smaragdicoccus niigatensis]
MHVPASRVALVGRESDIAAVSRRLMEPGRLVTITGCGGMGKTTVALEVARRLESTFPDGIWLADLSGVRAMDALAPVIGRAIGMRDSVDKVADQALEEFLRDRNLLLVLDNCEHVLDDCADLADILLDAAPGLHVIATSREPLRITGEEVHALSPLSTDAAADLFLSRVRRIRPSLPPADENVFVAKDICRQLDGIPLAIELAATAARSMSLTDIAVRVEAGFDAVLPKGRSRPERHQTMRATLEWSHSLLSPAEQVVFRRLSVLVDSWTMDAAQYVCDEPDIEQLIAGLVEKSLLVVDGELMYRMLVPVREFAYAQLAASGGVDRSRVRHCEFFVRQAELAEPALHGPDQHMWMQQLERNLANFGAAVRTANSHGDLASTLRLVGGLWWYLWLRGDFRAGLLWLEPALVVRDVPPDARLAGLRAAAMLRGGLGHSEEARNYANEMREIAAQSGNDAELSRAEMLLGIEALRSGSAARPLFEAALEAARRAGNPMMIGHAMVNLGRVEVPESKQALFEEALAHFEANGDAWGTAYAANHLANALEDNESALALAVRAVHLFADLGDRFHLVFVVEDLARILLRMKRGLPATHLFGWAGKLRRDTGALLSPDGRADCAQTAAELRSELGDSAYDRACSAGASTSIERLLAEAQSIPVAPSGLV